MITAVTVNASRNADKNAAENENISENKIWRSRAGRKLEQDVLTVCGQCLDVFEFGL